MQARIECATTLEDHILDQFPWTITQVILANNKNFIASNSHSESDLLLLNYIAFLKSKILP